MIRERWLLTVKLEPEEIQAQRGDGGGPFPYDDATRIIRYITEYWGLLPEDLGELAEWNSSEVKITGDTIDYFIDVIPYIMLSTIPISITLEREED